MAVSEKIRQFVAEGGWIRRVFEEGIALKAQIGAENVFDLSLGNPGHRAARRVQGRAAPPCRRAHGRDAPLYAQPRLHGDPSGRGRYSHRGTGPALHRQRDNHDLRRGGGG